MSITANKILAAVIDGNLAEVRALATRSNCNYQDPVEGLTLISWAVTRSHLEIAAHLVDLGASLLAKDKRGFLPIHRAAWCSSVDMCRLLLDNGALVDAANRTVGNITPLILASMRGDTNVVNFLCIRGARVDQKAEDGLTALSLAARCGSMDVVAFLMNAGADCYDARFQADIGSENTRTMAERERFNQINKVLCNVWASQSQVSIK